MNILVYSHFYPPEVGAASTRIKYFVKVLNSAGHNVCVITPKPNYPLGKIYKGFEKKIILKNKTENVVYLPILFVNSHTIKGRFISYISYSIFSFFYLLLHNYNPDIVLSSSPPIFTSLTALIYSKIKRSKFIFDVRDIWPDIGIELGILKSDFSIKGLRKIEKFILQNSNKVIVTARGDKKNILEKVNKNSFCEIIYNGADTKLFVPISQENKQELRKKYNISNDKIVLVYFGSYNNGMNDIETLGDFLSHEEIQKYNIHFLSIGSGDNLENLLKKINGKISFTKINSLPLEKVAKLVAASDISIIPRKNIDRDTGGNIPVKCFESWAAGVPVLISNIKNEEFDEIFDKCGAGVLVPPNNVNELLAGLSELLEKDLAELGVRGRQFVSNNFDRKTLSEKILGILMGN